MKKKDKKAAMGMVTTGVGFGVGSQVLGSVGSTHGQQAIGKISSAMPIMGSMYGTGMVIDSLKTLNKKAKLP